jgi:hypothetical protein
MKILKLFVFLFITVSAVSQNRYMVSGTISDKENNEPLPFASVTLKNHAVGTISNEFGKFDFYIPESMRNDTISVTFIGFNTYEIALKDVSGKLDIKLQPANNLLDEVILTDLGPLDYIKKALENRSENYPQQTYESLAYYREKFIENGKIIDKKEAVFKTYYFKEGDSVKNSHQLLLYRPAENPQKFQFMKEWIEKKQEKERKKAEKKGKEYNTEDDYDGTIDVNFGGPKSVIDLDINNGKEENNFLNPKYFKKYEYTFGDETYLDGERLVCVKFKAKKSIDYVKDQGKILISKENYAIVLIGTKGKFNIPFIVKPILFAVGISIKDPTFSQAVQYQKFKGLWYPKLFRWDADVKLVKRHMFDDNEISKINIGQVFSINNIYMDATRIPEEKVFDPNNKMEDQIHNDLNLDWQEINTVRD